MLQAFDFSATGAVSVPFTNTSTNLVYTVDLNTPTPVEVPAARADVTFDWNGVMTRSYGGPFTPSNITEVMIGRYEAGVNLEDPKTFASIKTIAKDLYSFKAFLDDGQANPEFLAGSADLAKLKNAQGAPFTGVPAGTTDQYLLALVCGPEVVECRNPTPHFVARLKTCATP